KNNAIAAGITQNVYAHLFRHTLATHLLQDGRTIVDVKEKLRHSNISVTSIYVHSNPEAVKAQTKSLGSEFLPDNAFTITNDGNTLAIMHHLLLHLLAK